VHGADESDVEATEGSHADGDEADSGHDQRPAAHASPEAPHEDRAQVAAPDKTANGSDDTGPFSFFSWMRREPDPKPDPK